MGIGELSRRTGVHIETIRYYEKVKIMPRPPRTSGGHRVYDADLLHRLEFVSRSRELGFTLEDVRKLLELVDGGTLNCGEVQSLALQHVESIEAKLSDLRRLKRVLSDLASKCQGGTTPDCPIIDTLSGKAITR